MLAVHTQSRAPVPPRPLRRTVSSCACAAVTGAPCAAIGWIMSTKHLGGDGVSQTELRKRDGQATTVSEDAITALTEVLRGRLVKPSDVDYDDARAVWNGMVDIHPALIVQCAGVADVVTSVNFAKEHNLLVAVRGG